MPALIWDKQASRPPEVAICIEDSSVADAAATALSAADLDFIRSGPPAEFEIAAGDPEPAAVLLWAERLDRESIRVVRDLRSRLNGSPLVLVCGHVAGPDVRRALETGICGVVRTSEIGETLAITVVASALGQVCAPRDRTDRAMPRVLTSREKQILGLVVMGMSNSEIASELYLAQSTVKSHLSSAFAKLGVSSRNEATRLILDPDQGAGLGILKIPAEPMPPSRIDQAANGSSFEPSGGGRRGR